MKKIIYFVIFIFCISFIYAQPAMPTVQIYGTIIGTVADGSEIAFEKDGIEIGLGIVNNNQYGYDPVIFIDANIGDVIDIFIDNIFINTITLQEEGTVNIDITIPTAPPPPTEEDEEEPTVRRGGGIVIPSTNHTTDFSQFPQTFNVRSGDRILLDFNGAQHTIRVARLRFQSVELLISSTPSTLNLNVDDEGEVDLDDDGITDIAILYNGVEEKRGVVIIRQLASAATVPQPISTPEPVVEEPTPELIDVVPEPGGASSLSIIITIIVILGILGGIGFVFYEMKRSHGALQQEKQQKTLEDQSFMRLQSYVKQTLEQGYTKNQIRKALLNEGWSQNIINKVLR